MQFEVCDFDVSDVGFVATVYDENKEALHGDDIPLSEWSRSLVEEADPDEINFIIKMNDENTAWLKLNGIESDRVFVSMLVVGKKYQRMGAGSFALKFAEDYAQSIGRSSIYIQTTADNTAAINCYLKQGYRIIKHTSGDREVIAFEKLL